MGKPHLLKLSLFCLAVTACGALLLSVRLTEAQSGTAECPDIYLYCPDSCADAKKPCSFTAVVKGVNPDQKLTYQWGVNKGQVRAGQGTSSVTVDLSGTDRKGITAVVEVTGVGERCPNKVSCSTSPH